jgi:hypothetical protein
VIFVFGAPGMPKGARTRLEAGLVVQILRLVPADRPVRQPESTLSCPSTPVVLTDGLRTRAAVPGTSSGTRSNGSRGKPRSKAHRVAIIAETRT